MGCSGAKSPCSANSRIVLRAVGATTGFFSAGYPHFGINLTEHTLLFASMFAAFVGLGYVDEKEQWGKNMVRLTLFAVGTVGAVLAGNGQRSLLYGIASVLGYTVLDSLAVFLVF